MKSDLLYFVRWIKYDINHVLYLFRYIINEQIDSIPSIRSSCKYWISKRNTTTQSIKLLSTHSITYSYQALHFMEKLRFHDFFVFSQAQRTWLNVQVRFFFVGFSFNRYADISLSFHFCLFKKERKKKQIVWTFSMERN